MPPPRYQHGFEHDVFLSYTHADDQPDGELRWVTKFKNDLKTRLEIVSGRTVDIWRDEEKLGAADRFDGSIAHAVNNSAVMLVVLSPNYFESTYCSQERQEFYKRCAAPAVGLGDKSRIVKIAKFHVELEKYPPELRELLEYKFYVELPATGRYREFHLSEDPVVRDRYKPRIDDVAQEIKDLLQLLEGANSPSNTQVKRRGLVYLAETTSDLEAQRDELRRVLSQMGYEVEPKTELRLLPAQNIRQSVSEAIEKCSLAIHPIGGYYGFVPEGADGKSVIQMQIELAQMDSRNGDLGRIIWVPEGLVPLEDSQKKFLERLRTDYAGRGFEFLERPYHVLTTRIQDKLKSSSSALQQQTSDAPSGVYIVCDNADRALAKNIRSFLFSQGFRVEWTPLSAGQVDLSGNPEHEKLLLRNVAHVVIHGATNDGWIQDRIRELDTHRLRRPASVQAIYLADPHRSDKDEILAAPAILQLNGYTPATLLQALQPLLDQVGATIIPPPAAGGLSQSMGETR
jgi:hypothetical protein